MAEELIKSVQEMLKEETWTRAAISNYSKEKLAELSAVIEKARNENCTKELKAICDEQLAHSKDSIIALYISGMIALQNGTLDNSELVTLVDIFKKNHKEAVVEYLCENILEDDANNKFALRTLADYYKTENNPKLWDLYVQIVKLDFEEADMAKLLAKHFEKEGDAEAEKKSDKAKENYEKATEYYKKAILRYVNAGNMSATKELWTKLVSCIPQEIDFFQLVKRKAAKSLGNNATSSLLFELCAWYKENKKWDIAIDLLKEILTYDQDDMAARREIVECFKGKYKGHSNLDDYIKSSNLSQSFRNVFEAINDFEKHISFDAKSFVFHRTWGTGLIRKVEGENLIINFGKKSGIRKMSLKMAVNALTPLAKEHIWVLKATQKKEELAKQITADPAWALKTIIKSFDNCCDFKRIKAELVPSILTPGQWTSWSTKAKNVLEKDSSFGVAPNDINMFTVREHEISLEEKLTNEFKAQKQFFARIDTLMRYVDKDETDKTSEMFAEMFNYFTAYLKPLSQEEEEIKVNEQVVASYLVVQRITAVIKALENPVKVTFQKLYSRIADPRAMYDALKDTKNTFLRRDFLQNVRMLPDWSDEYVRLFPTVLNCALLKALVDNGYKEKVKKLAVECFENAKDNRYAVLLLFKEAQDEEWFKEAAIPYEKQLITLIQMVELTFREINSHVNTTENKKINKNATTLLFENDTLANYMFKDNSEETVKRMYTLVNDIVDMDPSYKALLRNKILEKFPNFKFHVSEEKSSAPKGMMVTAKMLEAKKAELDKLQSVDIPENAKEIAEARAQGDLKENAEYKAAKEQQHWLNEQATKLQSELNRAVVFDPTTITTAFVSFATSVTLTNTDTGSDETYTILGPWESDPDNGVISYMAPFGNAIMDKKTGESVSFEINEHKYHYVVKSIEAVKFDR